MRILKAQISKWFWLKEVACKDALKSVILTPAIIAHAQRMDKVRDFLGRVINPTSWYRTTAYNALPSVGGVKGSWHIKGLATDFKYYTGENPEVIVKKWFEFCDEDGIPGGAIIYKTFVHLDSRTTARYYKDTR